jgi:hypothetical protein
MVRGANRIVSLFAPWQQLATPQLSADTPNVMADMLLSVEDITRRAFTRSGRFMGSFVYNPHLSGRDSAAYKRFMAAACPDGGALPTVSVSLASMALRARMSTPFSGMGFDEASLVPWDQERTSLWTRRHRRLPFRTRRGGDGMPVCNERPGGVYFGACLSPVSSSVLSIRSDGARCLSPSIAGGGADTGETRRRSTILAAVLETSAECGSRCTGAQAAVGVGDGVEAVRVGHNGGLIVTKSVPPKKERPSATSATPSPKLRDSHASGCLDYHVHAPSTRTAPNGPRSESESQVSSATVSPRACSGEGTVTSRAKL